MISLDLLATTPAGSFDNFIQYCVQGLMFGALFALIALGYTMVYGIIELINFAHGDLFMLGTMMGLTVLYFLGISVTTAADASFGLTALAIAALAPDRADVLRVLELVGRSSRLQTVAQRPATRTARLRDRRLLRIHEYRPLLEWGNLRRRPASPGRLAAGISGPGPDQESTRRVERVSIHHEGCDDRRCHRAVDGRINSLRQANKSWQGDAGHGAESNSRPVDGNQRRSSDRRDFLIGGALGGVGSVMYALYINTTSYQAGFQMGLYAFTAAVLGGIGNVPGAVLGGLVIGLVRSLGSVYVGETWNSALIFAILILILVFRPSGLLGARTREKV